MCDAAPDTVRAGSRRRRRVGREQTGNDCWPRRSRASDVGERPFAGGSRTSSRKDLPEVLHRAFRPGAAVGEHAPREKRTTRVEHAELRATASPRISSAVVSWNRDGTAVPERRLVHVEGWTSATASEPEGVDRETRQ
jgi:hypothetical protein